MAIEMDNGQLLVLLERVKTPFEIGNLRILRLVVFDHKPAIRVGFSSQQARSLEIGFHLFRFIFLVTLLIFLLFIILIPGKFLVILR